MTTIQPIDRRTLLKGGLATVAVAGPFAGFVNSASAAVFTADATTELVEVPDLRDGKVRLALPEGFAYRSFHDTEEPVVLDDGTVLPGRHDGMGAFRGPHGTVFLIRNHEVNGSPGAFGPRRPYDAKAGGGTTTVQVTKHGRVLRSWTSLNGTMMNCSGGVMPWGSWITCEETVNGPDVGPDFTGAPNTELEEPHGYIYEVPVHGRRKGREPRPITRAGRFAHEAVSWDPESGALYLTEDNFAFASGFYRYTPKQSPDRIGHLDNKGRLEMLAITGTDNMHLEGFTDVGTKLPVSWVPIADPDPDFPMPEPGQVAETSNDTALTAVSSQGWEQGAAYFSRNEGQVCEDGVVFFTSTQGGGDPETGNHDPAGFGNGHGQIWAYDTRAETLELIYVSPGAEVLDFPDNVTSRNGTIIICEDGNDDNYVRALRPDGTLVNIAWNRLYANTDRDRTDDEFAGSTFSPDGQTLYVNIQASKGMTFAIWGPWEQLGI
jgi:uncharacterized protein